ncbi:MAG: response regulator transcription factor [Terriglobales bacterium]
MALVLVIDDEPMVRQTIRLVLERHGHQVVEAENGIVGLKKYDEAAFDLVITDILMPEKEGIGTIQDLRARNSAVKILAISGGGRVENLDYLTMAGQLGADDALPKPFEPRQLLEKVAGLCGSK